MNNLHFFETHNNLFIYGFMLLPQGCIISSVLCHNAIQRDLEQLDICKNIVVYSKNNIKLRGLISKSDKSTGVLGKMHILQRVQDRSRSGYCHISEDFSFQGLRHPEHYLKIRSILLGLLLLNIKKEEQYPVGLSRFWKLHTPHLRVLF